MIILTHYVILFKYIINCNINYNASYNMNYVINYYISYNTNYNINCVINYNINYNYSFVPLLTAFDYWHYSAWTIGLSACRFMYFIFNITTYVTVFTLVLISISKWSCTAAGLKGGLKGRLMMDWKVDWWLIEGGLKDGLKLDWWKMFC